MGLSNTPLVSAIVTTRNSQRTLEACLASIQQQTYLNIEILVVDRDSSDNTKDIAYRFTGKVYNQGPERSSQRNFAAQRAKGEYVAILDSDMELTTEVIQACVAAIQAPGVSGVVIPEESFGQGFWAQCKRLERSFYNGIDWMQAARFFRREDFIKLGGYREHLSLGEDWELSQRMAKLGSLTSINSLIFHNEGHLKLRSLMAKKIYYGEKYIHYARVAKIDHVQAHRHQTGLWHRYSLFFAHPLKLFHNPLYGCGMLLMKTCEFICGVVGMIKYQLGLRTVHEI